MGEGILIGLIGTGGVIIGSIITILGSRHIARKNHKYNLEKLKKEQEYRLKYFREEIFYKKKLEYYNKIAKQIENISYHYTQLITNSLPQIKEFFKNSSNLKEDKIQQILGEKIKDSIKELVKKEILDYFLPNGNSIYLDEGPAHKILNNFILNHTYLLLEIEKIKKLILKKETIEKIGQNQRIANNLLAELKKQIKP